jgi:hypothetical protein
MLSTHIACAHVTQKIVATLLVATRVKSMQPQPQWFREASSSGFEKLRRDTKDVCRTVSYSFYREMQKIVNRYKNATHPCSSVVCRWRRKFYPRAQRDWVVVFTNHHGTK